MRPMNHAIHDLASPPGKRKPIWLLLAFTLVAGSVYGASSPQPISDPKGQWIELGDYSDEFNEPSIDLSKWETNLAPWGAWLWDPANAVVSDGVLHLRMHYEERDRAGKHYWYTSGIAHSRATPLQYGYFEARVRASKLYPGVSPAFWVYRNDPDRWTEIDFFELTEQKDVHDVDLSVHAFRGERLKTGEVIHDTAHWKAPWDPRADFHVYGCEWDEREIRWYVDGELARTRANDHWHQPLDVTLSLGLRPPLDKHPSPDRFPAEFQVDYVRVWKKPETLHVTPQ